MYSHLSARQSSRSPCPNGGSNTYQKLGAYQIICDENLPAKDLENISMNSFGDCRDRCSATSSCIAVTYWSGTCTMKSSISRPEKIDNGIVFDSAILLPTDTKRDCFGLDAQVVVNGTTFKTYCNQDYTPNTFSDPYHAKSILDCIAIGMRENSTAVSYNAPMDTNEGYWNCYLKSAFNINYLVTASNMDTAVAVNDTAPSSSPSASVMPSAMSSSQPSSTVSDDTARSSKQSVPTGTIAGAAVGGLLGLVALLMLGWWLRKRHRSRVTQPDDVANMAHDYPTVDQKYHDAKVYNAPHEWSGTPRPAELGT